MAPLSRTITRAFAAGELAPSLSARADLALYAEGARTLRNFTIRPHGGVTQRPGTQFVHAVKEVVDQLPKLLPYIYSADESYVLEVGVGFLRFLKAGALVTVAPAAWSGATNYVVGDLVVSGGVNYWCKLAHINHAPPNATYWYPLTDSILEVPTPFVADLELLRVSQDGRRVTLTHPSYAPQELARGGSDTVWTIAPVVTAPGIAAPAGLGGSAGAAGSLNPVYVVTAAAADPSEESLPSASHTIASAAAPTATTPNALTWSAVAGAAEYHVYADPAGNGTFGYLGTATGQTTFNDVGDDPDFTRTPPQARVLFNSSDHYPACSASYQQRRVFGNTNADVQTVWASRSGFPSNFSIRSPLEEDDAITFRLKSLRAQPVEHFIPLERLVVLTQAGLFVVLGDQNGALTPTGIHPEQVAYSGAAPFAAPQLLGTTALYVHALGRQVRDLRVSLSQGVETNDLTMYAGHLFPSSAVRIALQDAPDSLLWVVLGDGTMATLTYLPESKVFGWARHDLAGAVVLDVCAVPEDGRSGVYVITQRTVNGSTVRYLERFASNDEWGDLATREGRVYLDCSISRTSAASTAVTGLSHLEGATVYALADGLVQGPFTVASGAITLTAAAATVHVGIAVTADLETLPLDLAQSTIRGQRKRVQDVTVLLESSVPNFTAGPDADHLLLVKVEGYQDATAMIDGQVEAALSGAFTDEGRVFIRHTAPTPLTILGLIPTIEAGG